MGVAEGQPAVEVRRDRLPDRGCDVREGGGVGQVLGRGVEAEVQLLGESGSPYRGRDVLVDPRMQSLVSSGHEILEAGEHRLRLVVTGRPRTRRRARGVGCHTARMEQPLDLGGHLAGIRDAVDAFATQAASAGLGAPVPTTPDWDVRRLVAHQGLVHRWATARGPRRGDRRRRRGARGPRGRRTRSAGSATVPTG